MKRKTLIVGILCLLFCGGCDQVDRTKKKNGNIENGYVWVEPIKIQGVEHDFIFWRSKGYAGGITHSPECWCQKVKRGEEVKVDSVDFLLQEINLLRDKVEKYKTK